MDRVGKFPDLFLCRSARCTFDPSVGVSNIFFGQPRTVLLDLYTNIALLKQNRCAIATQ